MKRLFIFVPLCVIIGALLACGASTNTGTTTGNTTPAATPGAHFKVGDTVTVGSTWKAVVNSVKTDDGGQYSALKPGTPTLW